jgi:hypothetical protein
MATSDVLLQDWNVWHARAPSASTYPNHTNWNGRTRMAQRIVSWFICDGRFRVHAINAVGQRSGRIIEIEDVDLGERVHGSARRLERLLHSLRDSSTSMPLTLPR